MIAEFAKFEAEFRADVGSSGQSDPKQPFTILVVCTGNICRSPLAELLLRSRLAAIGLDVRVASAGTSALVGEAMTPQSGELASRYSGQIADAPHVSSQLTRELIAGADLILTATREHSHAVAILNPRSARFTFTLAQFARYVGYLGEAPPEWAEPKKSDPKVAANSSVRDHIVALVADVVSSRGFAPPATDPTIDDIEDPYLQSQEAYDRVGAIIDAAVSTIVDYLAPAAQQAAQQQAAQQQAAQQPAATNTGFAGVTS